jgi:glycosidase
MNIDLNAQTWARAAGRLDRLYGDPDGRLAQRLGLLARRYAGAIETRAADPSPALCIVYPDQIARTGEPTLRTLKRFADARLAPGFSHLHVLPFLRSSSDEGFSVVHYRQIDPRFGDWDELRALTEHFELAADLVLNHCSATSGWFADYVQAIAPGRDFFIEGGPAPEWAKVVRPRTSPLWTPVHTASGPREVWTTFSADQVDLNYRNPDLLFEMLDILLHLAAAGARTIRLDAVAFLWKEPGTTCLHRPEAHEVVRLMRDLLEWAAPGVRLLTETNVPHAENIAYFGAGDEAHWVYQFPLPPLLLHALTRGDASALVRWLAALEPPPPGCAFVNFTASHDGIGVRPLEGLVPESEVEALGRHVEARGGAVSRRDRAGQAVPYELNTTWFDALGAEGLTEDAQETRFLCSQTVPLTLQGIPAVYLNSLVAAPNDRALQERTGAARSLNRTRWDERALETELDGDGRGGRVYRELMRRIILRRAHPALRPEGAQRIVDADPRLLVVERTAPGGDETLTCVANLSHETVPAAAVPGMADAAADVLHPDRSARRDLLPGECAWLGRPPGR